MTSSINFSDLGLSSNILQSLTENNISEPTEIQAQVIPFILTQKQNLVGISQTGTGKTAAYGLPLLQLIDTQLHQVQMVVLVPTRELSQQIAKDLFVFSRYIVRIRTEAVYGGVKIEDQIKKLETPKHILVATPGRLLDLISRKVVDLKHLRFLVLDEADQMLNMGFKPDIDQIFKLCKTSVRKFLFTSTMPAAIKKIVTENLGKDVPEIQIKPKMLVNNNIEHLYIPYKFGYKFQYLHQYLKQNPDGHGIVFCRTQAAAKLLKQQLIGVGINTGNLYGDLNQYERNKAMAAFKAKRTQLLVATDIAARGLDVQDLNFVIHYHLPDNDAQFVNRSGRTARAGKKGQSICLLQEDEIHEIDDFKASLNIKFEPIKLVVAIDDTVKYDMEFNINVGKRHAFNEASFIRFICTETGIKEEAIKDVYLMLTHTNFTVDSRYEGQLINNLHKTKHLNMKVLVEKGFTREN